MYYSVTQVCRCNEETRTNSSETSLTGQPLYDTSTNELYIGDGETTIQNLSPIQNLKAGTGMTYTNGSVSLNEGTQTNAGGIKVWAENNDIYYSTPNGVGAQLFPIIRTYHPGYNQTHSNSHTLRGTASTQYDTGERQPHNDSISMTLNYKGTTSGSGSATGYATGAIHCNKYTVLRKKTIGGSAIVTGYIEDFWNDEENHYNIGSKYYTTSVDFSEDVPWIDGTAWNRTNVAFTSSVTGMQIERITTNVMESGGRVLCTVGFYVRVTQQDADGGNNAIYVYSSINYPTEWGYSGSDTYGVDGLENVVISGKPNWHTGVGVNVLSINSKYVSNTEVIRTEAVADVNGATVVYNTPFTYTPDGYLYEGTATKDIGDDAESVSVYPATPDDTTAHVEYSGSTATITANCVSPTNVGSSITRGVTLSYNTPIYGYYTNVSTYIGSDYGAGVTSTSPSVTSYSSGTSGNYFWVNMRAASQTSVSASAVSYWDSWVPAYNSYHYPIELNGVRHNFNTIDLDGVNYAATAEKYNKR